MKKLLFLAVLTGLAVAVLYSCKKDFNQEPANANKTSYSAQEMQIWRSLNAFNAKVKSGVRDEEFISPDSAMWYLETLYNVTEASNVTYDNLVTDTTYYDLPLNENGEVSLSDVTTVYGDMISDMQSKLNSFQEDYKYLILGDVYDNTTVRGGSVSMGLVSGYGLNVLRLYEDIDSTDNWIYGNMYGKCNGTFHWLSDAGYELERRFNNPAIQSNPTHDTMHAINFYHTVASAANYPTYMYNIKWVNDTISDTCINYIDMQYYLVSGHTGIIYEYIANGGMRPAGLDFLGIDVTSNNKGAILTDSLYYHTYDIFYANFVTLPPIGD